MTKEEIAIAAKKLETRIDFLNLLNRIKHENIDFSAENSYPFTMNQLSRYCNPRYTKNRYRNFKIKKKTGGYRMISAPYTKTYKLMLQAVKELLDAVYVPSKSAHGFTQGRSVVTNAAVHKGQYYVFNIDLKDFFPSIVQPRIWKRLQVKPFEFNETIASLIAGLCCMMYVENEEDMRRRNPFALLFLNNTVTPRNAPKRKGAPDFGDFDVRFVLPQGAPTSPIITNIICDRLDMKLSGLAKRFGLRYSRYADDITFSSLHNVYQENSDFRRELKRIIESENFKINDKKTRLQKIGARQEVTGLIISEKVNVPREYARNLRNLLHIWEKYGYSVALNAFRKKYFAEKGHLHEKIPSMEQVVSGKLQYLKMVKGEDDPVFVKLFSKFAFLQYVTSETAFVSKKGIVHIDTFSVEEFERMFNTKIVVVMRNYQRYAYFVSDSKKNLISVQRNVPVLDSSSKKNICVSQCKTADGEFFWLMHKESKVVKNDKKDMKQNKKVDINELNNDLDYLLQLSDG